VLGRLGPLDVLKQVPFVPYVELAIWSGYFAFVPSVPGALLASREEAGKVAVFNTVQALLQIGATILFVVTLKQGALGVVRAQLTSAQLPTYFVGFQEHLDLEKAVRERDGEQFDLRKYNDTALSYGSPPVRYVRQMMLEQPID
jgi:hypothetical protein